MECHPYLKFAQSISILCSPQLESPSVGIIHLLLPLFPQGTIPAPSLFFASDRHLRLFFSHTICLDAVRRAPPPRLVAILCSFLLIPGQARPAQASPGQTKPNH
uniref:Uncharacterized protein n=1 Tax=Caenorhabditis japonica TaxID=281687 RepID=A0A8R1EV52_CAEJA